MWFKESVFYQIYPLGFCGAPEVNDGVVKSRILKVSNWVDHIKNLGCNAIYFSPIFESDHHGYDTRDYSTIDCRLGTNEDFTKVCKDLHDNDIKVVLDGVFNHVGRGFYQFQDVIKNRESSRYKDWFNINFNSNNGYNDGLSYEGWDVHYELVKLNLKNQEVVNHLFGCIKKWIDEFDIDGLRLDVAYMLDRDFLKKLRAFCKGIKEDFVLIGETIHGDYNQIVNDEMLDSCTNYECYKGLYSSFNSMNMFEISYSLNRQFGSEQWCIYRGKNLMSFVDNHDVERIASILTEKRHLPLIYGMLFGMPGIPCIYYGSEWGAEGKKSDGDKCLRPEFKAPESNELTELISKLAKIHRGEKTLCYGSYKNTVVTNKQLVFEREYNGEKIYVLINADSSPYCAHINIDKGVDLLTGNDVKSSIILKPFSMCIVK